jgi:hypothetical protein
MNKPPVYNMDILAPVHAQRLLHTHIIKYQSIFMPGVVETPAKCVDDCKQLLERATALPDMEFS